MDLLALLLVYSKLSGTSSIEFEAVNLIWYNKLALQSLLPDRPSNERRYSCLEPSGPRYEVKVLRKTHESQVLVPFDQSEGQVVALVPGQALNCGIGPGDLLSDGQRIIYLSAKDVLRWSKLSEWLDKFDQRNPGHEVAISRSEDLEYTNSLYLKLDIADSGANLPWDLLSVHVSDLPGDSSFVVDGNIGWLHTIEFVVETKVPLTLLVALPLIYGGIHLTTWNFHFASQTEHLLWKIACIDIMGTIPLSAILVFLYITQTNVLLTDFSWIARVLFAILFIFYALSRIYIVVESFISLRHVPIGVYAAIPWVQDIPHI